MGNFVGPWIFERVWFETKTIFTPFDDGRRTVDGLPLGRITSYTRKKVQARRATIGVDGGSSNPAGELSINSVSGEVTIVDSFPDASQGFYIDGNQNLHIVIAGGSEIAIPSLIQTNPNPGNDQNGNPFYPNWVNVKAAWGFTPELKGIGNMVLGVYLHAGIFTSSTYSWAYGAWGGSAED